jgi:hypothetical protein
MNLVEFKIQDDGFGSLIGSQIISIQGLDISVIDICKTKFDQLSPHQKRYYSRKHLLSISRREIINYGYTTWRDYNEYLIIVMDVDKCENKHLDYLKKIWVRDKSLNSLGII